VSLPVVPGIVDVPRVTRGKSRLALSLPVRPWDASITPPPPHFPVTFGQFLRLFDPLPFSPNFPPPTIYSCIFIITCIFITRRISHATPDEFPLEFLFLQHHPHWR
jgi:hypothetical protein